MANSMQVPFLVIASALFCFACGCHSWRTPAMTPPEGNSLYLRTIIKNGKYVYKCESGKWAPALATAELVNASNSDQILGNYSLIYKTNNLGIWYLDNGDEFSAESGNELSIVAGRIIATEPSDYADSLPQALAEASFHKNYGVASQISYIQRLYTKGGLAPSHTCSKNKEKLTVEFQGQFWFYRQDMVPPSMPESIQCPNSSRVVTGFFCKGVATYVFNGTAWRRTSLLGKLFNVPGGNVVGTYYIKKHADANGGNFCLEINNPSGWSVTARLAGSSVQVQPDSLPWSLFKVTASSGNTKLLGPFSYFQMVGTRGGLAPDASKTTRVGSVFRSPFCNQFWIYK